MSSINSLGSGNHFIEIFQDHTGKKYLVVHSGLRHLGHQIAQYHQRVVEKRCMEEVPRDLKYLDGKYVAQYLEDMKVYQTFPTLNRLFMILRIAHHPIPYKEGNLSGSGWKTPVPSGKKFPTMGNRPQLL